MGRDKTSQCTMFLRSIINLIQLTTLSGFTFMVLFTVNRSIHLG
jgi:hypothetical protein